MEAYGSLARVFQQPSRELCELLGLDIMTTFLLKVTKTSMKHLVAPAISARRGVTSHEALIDYLTLDFRDAEQEILRVIYLDAKCNIIQNEEISRGTVNTVPVYPREIGKRALGCSAASVILAHNHLTDDPTPSRSDIDATIKICRALQALDIILNDHVIIARGQSLSMRAEGLI
jgi:DNA repair protein RadC